MPLDSSNLISIVENDKKKRGVRISKNLFDGLSTVFCHSLHVQVFTKKCNLTFNLIVNKRIQFTKQKCIYTKRNEKQNI